MTEKIVCVGMEYQQGETVYFYVSLEDLSPFSSKDLKDNKFNEKKYKQFKRGVLKIYTVLGIVERYNSPIGYIVSNNYGDVELYTEKMLIKLLKNNYCMNYTIRNSNNKFTLCKNPNITVKHFDNEEIKKMCNINFDDLDLHKNMTLDAIRFCMKKNDFKEAYCADFNHMYYREERPCKHLIYFNKEGVLICLNIIETDKKGVYDLNYFGQSCTAERILDSKKYHAYLAKGSYISASTSPIGEDTKTGNCILKFQVSKWSDFFRFINSLSEYSKPCWSYICEDRLGYNFGCLFMTPEQEKKKCEIFDKYVKLGSEEKRVDYIYSILFDVIVGFRNLQKYSKDLLPFYSNILGNFTVELKKYKDENKMNKKYFDIIMKEACKIS